MPRRVGTVSYTHLDVYKRQDFGTTNSGMAVYDGRAVQVLPLDPAAVSYTHLKFEWVLQKGTEIGVAAFVPVITRRSLVRDAGDVGENKLERWRRIIKEAAEQSGRGKLPTIGPAVPLAVALSGLFSPPEQEGSGSLPLRGRVREKEFVTPATRALIAWEGEPERTLRQALGETKGLTDVALFIGPEGGYEAAEVEAAAAHRAIPITLGRRVLRTETAAVVGAALVLYELGEMGAA